MLPEFQAAKWVKVNPDRPQAEVAASTGFERRRRKRQGSLCFLQGKCRELCERISGAKAPHGQLVSRIPL